MGGRFKPAKTLKMDAFIFCFGSNDSGVHGAGAAKHAALFYGARSGVGRGLCGTSYALPTRTVIYGERGASLKTRSLEEISREADILKAFAGERPDLSFQITRLGCGLAGYRDEEIAPLFFDLPANAWLSGRWEVLRRQLRQEKPLARVVVAGSRSFDDLPPSAQDRARGLFQDRLERLLGPLSARHRAREVDLEIVSGGARGIDTWGERFAMERDIPLVRAPALWDTYGKVSGHLRNQFMSWYGTHLMAFPRNASPGTHTMVLFAQHEMPRENIRVIQF